MKIKALKLKDVKFDNWHEEVEDHWHYEDFLNNEKWRTGKICFDCCLYVPETERVYCGLTSFDADIFKAYDRKSEKFVDCGFGAVKNPYDAKFHRSLVRYDKDGCLYAAIALLHDIDRYMDAPGGAIVRYNPLTGDICKLSIPIPHHYIQSICLAQDTGIIYGTTFPPEKLFSFELNTGTVRDLGPLSSGFEEAQSQNVEIDSEGCIWSGWGITRAWQPTQGPDTHRLCKYDPEKQRIVYYNTGLPHPDGSHGFVKVEGFFNLCGELFASGGNGSIYQVDTKSGKGEYLFTPIADRPSRLASLRMGPDGYAYGITGKDGNCDLLQFSPDKKTYKLLGKITDGKQDCFQVHDLAITPDGVIYACENESPYRCSYLWEIKT